MTRKTFMLTAWLLALVLVAASVPALEVGGSFRFDNLGFATDRASTDATFTGLDYFWGGEVYLRHQLSDNLSMEAGFRKDDILRLLGYAEFEYRLDYFRLGLGTFLGAFNSSSQLLQSGITTSIGLELPSIAFLTFRADNSIGARLVEVGDYIQERSDVSLGFYVPNVICSLNLESKSFTQKQATAEVVDTLTVYSLRTDIYQKNLPFRVLLTFGYQTLAKRFVDASASPPTSTLNSIILGTELDLSLTNYLLLVFSLDSSIYSFGQDQLLGISNPGPAGYLFRAVAGFSIDFEQLRNRRLRE